jgi:hypothetical protein
LVPAKLKNTHDERRGCHRDGDGVLTLRTEVLTLRKEYKRHTEGDKVSIEGSAVEKTHRIRVYAQRKRRKTIDTQKVKNKSIEEKGCGMSV